MKSNKYLYHMDLLRGEEIEKFIPRVPNNRLSLENSTIKRICVSTTLEGCLGSAPWGASKVFEFPENMIFRVYEFDVNDINNGNLLLTEDLMNNNYVADACLYDECWIINQDIKPSNIFYIKIDNYDDKLETFLHVDENSEVVNESRVLVLKDLAYTMIDKSELIYGHEFEFSLKELELLTFGTNDIENVKNRLVSLMGSGYVPDYLMDDMKEYDEDDKYIIELNKPVGLWYKDFLRELEKDLISYP